MAHPILTWCFTVVVARRGDCVLLVKERKHHGWYFPAGGVEPGETFAQAALRETLEEAGVRVRLTGLLRVEHTPVEGQSARLRVIYLAEPTDDAPPKRVADRHSVEARWLTREELAALPLRAPDVLEIIGALERGCCASSLAVLQPEWVPPGEVLVPA